MHPSAFARLPRPPYYAVIFSAQRTDVDDGYGETAARMVELAAQQPGFLGVESTRGEDRLLALPVRDGDAEAVLAWRQHAEHAAARERGRAEWYRHFELRIAKVERAYGWDRDKSGRGGTV